MRVEALKVGFLETNCYVLEAGDGRAVVIDPGADSARMIEWLEKKGLAPALMLITHGHADHIGGVAGLREKFPDAKIAIGRADAPALTSARINQSAFIGLNIKAPPADRLLDDGDTVEQGAVKLKVIATPGHTPGGVCFFAEDIGGAPALFCGDTLFRESVGRCDIAGGDWNTLMVSVHRKLFMLPEDTAVYPGHGPSTTIGYEKENNPFAGEAPES